MPHLKRPKILCDANIPYKLIKLLTEEGFDIIAPAPKVSDEEIAQIANKEERIIVTLDKHFGNILLFPPEKYSGIILIRISPPIINSVFSSLTKLFDTVDSSEFKGKLYVLSLAGYRFFPK